MEDREESLRRYLEALVRDVEAKPYEYWVEQPLHITSEDEFEGRDTQVEINVLEVTPEYVHVQVIASNSPRGWYDIESTTVIITR